LAGAADSAVDLVDSAAVAVAAALVDLAVAAAAVAGLGDLGSWWLVVGGYG
jgi:hypothetical protein